MTYHILYVPSGYPTDENPIRGIFFQEQAQAMRSRGHKVGVVVAPELRSRNEILKTGRKAFTVSVEDDIPVYRSRPWGWFRVIRPTSRTELIIDAGQEAFERYVRKEGRPDLIHAHTILLGGYLATQFGARWGIPVVVTEHSSAYQLNRIVSKREPLIVSTLTHADQMVAVSPAVAGCLSAYCPDIQIEIVGNMVDTTFFRPPAIAPEKEPFVFASIGLMDANKRYDLLLSAFAKAFAGEMVQLRLGGAGKEMASLVQLSTELDIESQVRFLGAQTREQVRELIQSSHVVVSSSNVETFGVSLIEAMACGKPVVATRSGGPQSFVDATNGILTPVGDEDAMAKAFTTIRRDYTEFDFGQIREQCIRRFGQESIARQLERIYESSTLK